MGQTARASSPHEAADLGVVRAYSLQLKMACDDLHDDPFDTEARARLLAILTKETGPADAALDRLSATSP